MSNLVLTTIHERRSTLRFKSDAIKEEKIRQILDAGRWAPSFINRQPWEFVVITDPSIKRKLSQIGVRVTLFSEGIIQAPVVLVIAVDPRKDPLHYIEDGSAATQNMVIAAHSLGLASYWIGIFNLHESKKSPEEAVKKILGIPKDLRVIALLPIGRPAYAAQSDRKSLEAITHRNHYGLRE